MYKDKFVLSIISGGHVLRESGSKNTKQVVVPFGNEYKIRLKNKNDRSCTANITIDGTPVSNFGDVIVNAGGTIDLERFITGSMTSGKKFKFVDLDNPDVDDPTKSENGIIRVKFHLAKQKNGIKIQPQVMKPCDFVWFEDNSGFNWKNSTFTSDCSGGNMKSSDTTVTYCASGDVGLRSSLCGDTEDGATIEGGNSNQSFTYSTLDVDSHTTVLKLKIVGIRNSNVNKVIQIYCTKCGHRIKRNDDYCGGCGKRI